MTTRSGATHGDPQSARPAASLRFCWLCQTREDDSNPSTELCGCCPDGEQLCATCAYVTGRPCDDDEA